MSGQKVFHKNPYWENGEGYNRYITNELNSFRKAAWKKQICSHFPEGRKRLRILDLGCGPGFFSCILTEEGHVVTGIDNSQGMLRCARDNAAKLGISPEFLCMDINELSFEDNAFDAIVTRNVTWTLEYPRDVYSELKRVLKPGGILLIYDANWHAHLFDEEMNRRVKERERAHFEKYGTVEVITGESAHAADEHHPMIREKRPEWDEKVLSGELGMEVTITEDIGRFVYEQWEKELYAEHPLFEICAVKQEKT